MPVAKAANHYHHARQVTGRCTCGAEAEARYDEGLREFAITIDNRHLEKLSGDNDGKPQCLIVWRGEDALTADRHGTLVVLPREPKGAEE